MTKRIDGHLSAKLQACALNFNSSIKVLFGQQYALDSELSFALQFAAIDMAQRRQLTDRDELPAHIETMRETFENGLSDEQYGDQKYAYRVIFVPKIASSRGQADSVMEFVPADSSKAAEMNATYLKEVDKARHRPSKIVEMMSDEFPNFAMHHHTNLWKTLDAKNPAKGFGVMTESDGWRWYDRWAEAVRQHCEENRETYG